LNTKSVKRPFLQLFEKMDHELIDLTAGEPKAFDISSASAKALRRFISSRGLRHDDCAVRTALQDRAREAIALPAVPPASGPGTPPAVVGAGGAGAPPAVAVAPAAAAAAPATSRTDARVAGRKRAHASLAGLGSPAAGLNKATAPGSTGAARHGDGAEEEAECGCCFSDAPFSKLTQCSEGGLFMVKLCAVRGRTASAATAHALEVESLTSYF